MVNSIKYIIYYTLTITVNIITGVIFKDNIILTELSFVPSFLLLLSVFQAVYFYNNREKNDFNTNYSLSSYDLSKDEWTLFTEYMKNGFLLSLPLYIPFIIFSNG